MCSEERHRFQAFRGASAARRSVIDTVFTPAPAGASSTGLLHILSRTPLALHSFSGVDMPPGVAAPHAQSVRTIDLAGTLLPASMGGLARSSQGRRGGGMGSVFKNEVWICLCSRWSLLFMFY